MWKLDINDLVEFTDERFNAVPLVNKPDMRLMLLCMRAGQKVPEHSSAGSITVQAISGRATFYDGEEACEMCAGTILRLDAGRLHSVEAHTDTTLLVTMVKTPEKGAEGKEETERTEREIDLCLLARSERHPLVFEAFDSLAVGESLIIFNDHDPRPLKMQLMQMREGKVDWQYVEQGPDTFRVRLTRIKPRAEKVG